jgi:Sterol desaturase
MPATSGEDGISSQSCSHLPDVRDQPGLQHASALALVWLQSKGWGLFNAFQFPAIVAIGGAILALDLAWYVTHVSMHKFPAMWRFHIAHHSDPQVDVTTTVRQHPEKA